MLPWYGVTERGGVDERAPDLVDWIRTTALSAMADWPLEGNQLADDSQIAARVRGALTERADVEWRFGDGQSPRVSHRSVDHAMVGGGGASKFLVIAKPDLAEVWIRVGGLQTEPVATVLEYLVATGRWAVWLRWVGELRRVPTGVALVDLTSIPN